MIDKEKIVRQRLFEVMELEAAITDCDFALDTKEAEIEFDLLLSYLARRKSELLKRAARELAKKQLTGGEHS